MRETKSLDQWHDRARNVANRDKYLPLSEMQLSTIIAANFTRIRCN